MRTPLVVNAGDDAVSVSVVDPGAEPRWDDRLAELPDPTVFHSAAWSALLKETYGFHPCSLVAQQGPRLLGLLPFMEVKSLSRRVRGVSLPFTDSCPLLAPLGEGVPDFADVCREFPAPGEAVGGRLIRQARQLALGRGWDRVEFRPAPRAKPDSHASIQFVSHVVPVRDGDVEQRSLCLPPTRRTLKQALSGPLRVEVGTDAAFVRAYYRLHCQTRRSQGGPPQPFAFFAGLQRHLFERNLGFVVLATEAGSPVAGAVFLHFCGRAVYKFGASNPTRLHLRPNQLVMWTGLRHAAAKGCCWMDMGRTSLENHGLCQFKRGWGASESALAYHAFDLHTGYKILLSDRTKGWQTVWFRKLPGWIGRFIGRVAYRFAA